MTTNIWLAWSSHLSTHLTIGVAPNIYKTVEELAVNAALLLRVPLSAGGDHSSTYRSLLFCARLMPANTGLNIICPLLPHSLPTLSRRGGASNGNRTHLSTLGRSHTTDVLYLHLVPKVGIEPTSRDNISAHFL